MQKIRMSHQLTNIKHFKVRTKHFKDPKGSIKIFHVKDVYPNIDDFNPNKKYKIVSCI